MSIVSIKDLLQAGVHFGHQSRFWNPKMEEYIFDTRKKISIINLETTQSQLNAAASRVESICSRGNKLLFVGTKRSASKSIREKASSLGLPYVDKRWLGGTLTNWKTIRSSIRRLSDLEEMMSSGRIEKLSKKEASFFESFSILPDDIISSKSDSLLIELRIVFQFVSVPPSHLLST